MAGMLNAVVELPWMSHTSIMSKTCTSVLRLTEDEMTEDEAQIRTLEPDESVQTEGDEGDEKDAVSGFSS